LAEDGIPVTWQVWKDSLGAPPSMVGDINWGATYFDVGEYLYSNIQFLGSPATQRLFTLLTNKYDTGRGFAEAYIRGSETPFSVLDLSPAWELYTVPIFNTWSYVQVRLKGTNITP